MQAVAIFAVLEKFFSNKIVQYTIIFLIVAFGIWWGVKKLILQNPKNISLPDGGKGVPKGWEPDGLAQELHDVLDGVFTLGGTKERVVGKLSVLSNDQLVMVYNKFNDLFARDKDGSLYTWIQDEYWIDSNITEPILQRMRDLKLI